MTKGNSVNTAFNESYSYDNLNQLSNFTRGSHTQSWDFDALGNWNSVTTDGTTQTRSHNKQNEITSVSGATTPTFDANGNMTKDETGKQFVYDAWNRIKIVKDAGGTTLKTYGYNALNRRVSETVGSNTTDLYYSAGWQVLEERVNGSGKYRYVWSPVYVDAMILRDRLDASERIWVQQDANFNVTAITDNSGVILERYAYDSYGKVTVLNASWTAISSSAYEWLYLHQGGRLDATSGLYYFRNRDYSPMLGHWVTMDPIEYDSGSSNLYEYLGNTPANVTDASGLQWLPTPGMAGQGHLGRTRPLPLGRAPLRPIRPPLTTVDDRFDYFENVGFVDWGHAQPTEARAIINAVRRASPTGQVLGWVGNQPSQVFGQFCIRNVTAEEQLSVAFSIYMFLVLKHENFQAGFRTESGWSQEDVPSNIIGFYMAANNLDKDGIIKSGILGRQLDRSRLSHLVQEIGGISNPYDKNGTLLPVNHNRNVRRLFPSLDWRPELIHRDKFAKLYKQIPIDTTGQNPKAKISLLHFESGPTTPSEYLDALRGGRK